MILLVSNFNLEIKDGKMLTIPIESLDKNISSLVKKAIKGEEIIFSEKERPVAKIEPVISGKKPVSLARGFAKDIILNMSDDFDEIPEDFKDYI